MDLLRGPRDFDWLVHFTCPRTHRILIISIDGVVEFAFTLAELERVEVKTLASRAEVLAIPLLHRAL